MTTPITEMLPKYLTELTLASILFRLALATALGGLLGIERERKRRPAGFRTYMLVCVGASLVMMTNQYIFSAFGSGDISRLGAQVISGIGFLGAGTIIITGHNRISGLTTAAGLWASACIGLAVGIGFYFAACLATLLMFFVMTYLHKLDVKLIAKSNRLHLFIEFDSPGCIGSFIKKVKSSGYTIHNMDVSKADSFSGASAAVLITVKTNGHPHDEVLATLSEAEGIIQIEEI